MVEHTITATQTSKTPRDPCFNIEHLAVKRLIVRDGSKDIKNYILRPNTTASKDFVEIDSRFARLTILKIQF